MSGANDSRARREPSTFEIQEQVRSLKKSIQGWEREYRRLRDLGAAEEAQGKRDSINYYQKEIDDLMGVLADREGHGRPRGPTPISLLLHAAVNALVASNCPERYTKSARSFAETVVGHSSSREDIVARAAVT